MSWDLQLCSHLRFNLISFVLMGNIFLRDLVKQNTTMSEPVWTQTKTLAIPSLYFF